MRRAACRTANASIFEYKNMSAYMNLSYAYETTPESICLTVTKTPSHCFYSRPPTPFFPLSFVFVFCDSLF